MYFWIIKIRLFDKHTIEQTTDVRIFNPATSNINRAVWSLFKSEEKNILTFMAHFTAYLIVWIICSLF